MLEIDVVESGFIGKPTERTQENKQASPSRKHKSASRLKQIEAEKQAILDELRKVEGEIAEIRGEPVDDLAGKRKEKVVEEQAARKQAQNLVKQLKREKK